MAEELFPYRLRQLRERRRMNRAALSECCGLSKNAIGRYERGEREPTMSALIAIICDSAEPKSVADFRAMRLPAFEAIKGPGSVEYGMKFLQRRTIVIDRRRTPNAYNEFVGYEYERNKDGDIISGYPDANNHLIDATRYALEPVSRRMGVIA